MSGQRRVAEATLRRVERKLFGYAKNCGVAFVSRRRLAREVKIPLSTVKACLGILQARANGPARGMSYARRPRNQTSLYGWCPTVFEAVRSAIDAPDRDRDRAEIIQLIREVHATVRCPYRAMTQGDFSRDASLSASLSASLLRAACEPPAGHELLTQRLSFAGELRGRKADLAPLDAASSLDAALQNQNPEPLQAAVGADLVAGSGGSVGWVPAAGGDPVAGIGEGTDDVTGQPIEAPVRVRTSTPAGRSVGGGGLRARVAPRAAVTADVLWQRCADLAWEHEPGDPQVRVSIGQPAAWAKWFVLRAAEHNLARKGASRWDLGGAPWSDGKSVKQLERFFAQVAAMVVPNLNRERTREGVRRAMASALCLLLHHWDAIVVAAGVDWVGTVATVAPSFLGTEQFGRAVLVEAVRREGRRRREGRPLAPCCEAGCR